MASTDPKQSRHWEERINEASARFDAELQRVVRYIDNEVVPEVRRQSSTALRNAAAQLHKLAEHMDDEKRGSTADSAKKTEQPL